MLKNDVIFRRKRQTAYVGIKYDSSILLWDIIMLYVKSAIKNVSRCKIRPKAAYFWVPAAFIQEQRTDKKAGQDIFCGQALCNAEV